MTTSVAADQAALLERLDRLEAERDIHRLMVRYAESLDYGDKLAWADCFTADGDFDVRLREAPMFAHQGTAALEDFAAQHTHAPDVYHKHFLSIPTIEFGGNDQASARTYFT